MKNFYKNVKERREKILNSIPVGGYARIADLATMLNVTPLTIRRDIQHMLNDGKIQKGHGIIYKTEYKDNDIQNIKIYNAKKAIAQIAASLINKDDIVYINSSSTALDTLDFLDYDATIVTNNGNVLKKSVSPKIRLLLTGGDLSFPKHAMTGEFALSNLKNVSADISIIGCSGLSIEKGITTSSAGEVAVNKYMLSNATKKRVLVCDSSKLGLSHAFLSGKISDIDILITDSNAQIDMLDIFKQMNVKIIVAEV